MRYRILLPIFILFSLISFAQRKPDKAYAIVGAANGNFSWINIQEIDLSTGEVSRNIYDKEKTVFQLLDSKTKKDLSIIDKGYRTNGVSITPRADEAPTSVKNVQVTKAELVNEQKKLSKINYFKSATPATVNKEAHLQEMVVKENTPVTVNARVVRSGVIVRKLDSRNMNHQRLSRAYESPTATAVAATAYDQRHNKLFFTPMNFGELRWIDLYDRNSALKVYCVTDQPLTPKDKQNEATQITRMVIAADGNGYALSNDGSYFIRFTTGKQPVITQLGALKDDAANNEHSIHSRTMYGGDMIADAFGGLYLISGTSNVFKIDISGRQAKYLGAIQGLPKRYTTNGAAINNNGDLIVSSATATDGYFKVDLENLQAEKVGSKHSLNSSDLASGNLAFENRKKDLSNASLKSIDLNMSNGKVTVFPNPVVQDNFRVNFKQSDAGQYDVQLVDLSGKIVFQKRVNVGMRNQVENIVVDKGLSRGVYMVKIVDRSKKLLSSGNLVLQ